MVKRTDKHTNTEYYTYKKFLKGMTVIVNELSKKKYKFDGIYPIPRGGLIPGVFLSHSLDLPILDIYDVTEKTLIVDDICDTGETLKKFKHNWKAVMLGKCKGLGLTSKIIFDNILIDDCWVEFFWEKHGGKENV